VLERLHVIAAVVLMGAVIYLDSAVRADSERAKSSLSAETGETLPPLEFNLFDSYGREVRWSDYRGAPVLIMSGACWCGGCQSDAEPLRVFAEKYRERGLQVIRSVSYDNELPAWEFQKHYRLPFVQLMDPNREFERRYNKDGWTFLMLADGQGKVVYWRNSPLQDAWSVIGERLETMLPEHSAIETVNLDGISYMPATVKRSGETEKLRRCDRFPSLACAEDGHVYVTFTTNRNGTQDVYLRVFNGQQWLLDGPVAATEADEFDGTVIVDRRNRPWISWTSNAGGPQYNSFVFCLSESSSQSKITHSEDDAMHARMAADAQGRIWATYYKWQKMKGISRDKEVYARYLERNRWSKEIHVSPEDVPAHEDHTDPAIAALGDSVVIGWSWDFHRPNKGYSEVCNQPSIFLRKIGPGSKLGFFRAISGNNIDTRPTIAPGPEGRVWCAWESVQNGSRGRKMVSTSIEDLNHDQQPGVGKNATGLQKNICTPSLAVSSQGKAALVWSESDAKGRWTLKQAIWDHTKSSWDTPRTLVSQGNPRFPSAAYTKDGVLWVAYCVDKDDRREVAVLKVEKNN
jgi:peroxiredoxin